jgi:hypothetical protein
MLNILNQPYLALDQHVDIKTFDAIVDDIILGVAKSSSSQGPTYPGPGYLDKSKKSIHEIYRGIMADHNHPYYEKLKELKKWEPYNFVKYKWGGHSLGQCLILRESGTHSYLDKHDETKCVDHPIKSNFTVFLDWINSQNIFSSIGRIVIFLNETGTSVLEHRDYPDGNSRKDEFIWIAPLGNKNFFVRDNFEKHYIKSRFCYFDNANIHGSDQLSAAAFSIRLDGKFSKEFIARTGLTEHLND